MKRRYKYLYIGWSVVYLLLVGYVPAFMLWPEVIGKIVRCPLHALTGLHCPTCGMSRAMSALLHGELLEAMRLNPLCLLASMLAVAMGVILLHDLTHRHLWLPRIFCGTSSKIFGFFRA